MSRRIITLFLLVAIIITFTFGCTSNKDANTFPTQVTNTAPPSANPQVDNEENVEDLIVKLVKKQEEAIINADVKAMLTTINIDNSWLAMETKNLVADQKIAPVKDYTRTVTDIKKTEDYWLGTISQNFLFNNKTRPSSSTHKYIFDGTNVYDAGIAFEVSVLDQVTAYYPKQHQEFTKAISDVTNAYIDLIQEDWKTQLSTPVAVKIYEDRNVFLNSVKLSLPNWAGGWYEAKESIKFYIRSRAPKDYYHLMRHETTHMMLADVTNDNASYWLQEGFATTMPNTLLNYDLFNDLNILRQFYDSDNLPKVTEHIAINLENITARDDVRLYYSFSNAMIIYMLENMKKDTLLAFFNELASYPNIPVTVAEKIPETNKRVLESIKKATGKSFEEFYDGFDKWLIEQLK